MARRILTKDQVVIVHGCHAAGWSAQRIATKLGCSPTTIFRTFSREGILPRSRGPTERSVQIRLRHIDRIVRLYVAERWSTTKIGEKFKVSHFFIRKILMENGVTLRAAMREPIPLPAAAWELILQGVSQKEIAASVGLTPSILAKRESRLGVPDRKGKAFAGWRARMAKEAARGVA